jgi:hypothetical protein
MSMSDSPTRARATSSRHFIAAVIFGALWTALRLVPDDASDWLLLAAGLLKGPALAVTLVCMLLAFRHRGWADGFEAARSREKADHA